MDSKEQGSSIVRECVKTLKVNTNLSLTTEYDVCIINQSEAFQKRERGEVIPEVSFNVSDKALRIQEAKSKVPAHTAMHVYINHACFAGITEYFVSPFASLHFLLYG